MKTSKPQNNRKQFTINLTLDEKARIDKVCKAQGEQFSSYIRRQILVIVDEGRTFGVGGTI